MKKFAKFGVFMTLAVVVAYKDGFYLMADTRMQDVATNTISDNSQKVFYSNKHKLGICIMGDAILSDPYDKTNENKAFYVNYILNEFFKDIEARDVQSLKAKITSIADFLIAIQSFIKNKFGEQYVLQFQNHASFLLAGIINGEPVIGSYYGEKNKEFDCFNYSADFSKKLCVFSNYQICFDKYSKDSVNDPSCPYKGNQIEKQNALFGDPNTREYVFNQIVDGTRLTVLQQHPHSINEYFQYVKIGQADTDFKNIKLKVEGDKFVVIDTSKGEYFPNCIILKTKNELIMKSTNKTPAF